MEEDVRQRSRLSPQSKRPEAQHLHERLNEARHTSRNDTAAGGMSERAARWRRLLHNQGTQWENCVGGTSCLE